MKVLNLKSDSELKYEKALKMKYDVENCIEILKEHGLVNYFFIEDLNKENEEVQKLIITVERLKND
ncbi:MAG: hypothetical protein WAW57_15270 [Lutibacter sp.]